MSTDIVLPYETLRRWPRHNIEVPVRLITQKPTKAAVVQARGKQLSRGGMTVFAGVELCIDEQVAVEFIPPHVEQPIRVRSLVRNRSGYKYGVEFIIADETGSQDVGQIEAILRTMGEPVN
jgi:PilZ domain-containing protein